MGAFRFGVPVLLAGLTSFASAQNGESKEELFRWFETLGFEKRLAGEFVVYEITQTRNGKTTITGQTIGFKRPARNRFESVATFSLYEAEVFGDANLRPADFRSEAKTLLNLQAKYAGVHQDHQGSDYHKRAPWSIPAEPFVMSWFAAKQRSMELSDELFGIALKLAKDDEQSLRASLIDWFTGVSFRDIQEMIADPKVPFSQVRTACAAFLNNYPAAELTASVRSFIQSIDAAAAGDRAWESRTKLEGQAGQIEELIYRLKEQTGHQSFNKAPASVFTYSREGEKMPADQLKEIGYAAMPALIEALTDRRMTRTVATMWVGERSVLTVGDAARQIIEAILPVRPDSEHQNEWRNDQLAYGRAVLKLLEDIEVRGDRAIILEQLEKSTHIDHATLQVLTEKYPADALKFISRRLAKETDEWYFETLLEALGQIKHPESVALLIKVLESDPLRKKRLIAAKQVAKAEPDRVFKALSKEWKKEPDAELVEMLVDSGRKEAIALMDADISRLNRAVAFSIAESLCQSSWSSIWRDYDSGHLGPDDSKHADYFRASEALLVRLLGDTRDMLGLTMDRSSGETSFEVADPRICDMAAFSLGTAWPSKYPFIDSESEFEMDLQRIAFANIWRKANGQPPLPVPARPVLPTVDETVLAAALDKFEAEPTAANRAEIIKLGPASLPGIEARIKSAPTGKKNHLEALAVEVSLIVREVKIEGELTPSVRKTLESLKNSSLTVTKVIQVLTEIEAAAKDRTSISFSARRLTDGNGFTIALQVEAMPLGEKSDGQGQIWIEAGGDCFLSMAGGGGFFEPGIVYEDIPKDLKRALATGPREAIRISYSMTR